MPLGERVRGRLRYGLDNPFTRNIDPTLVLDLPFSEGIGNIAHDRSLYGNHGTIYGASWVDGKIGKALNFDGIDDKVVISDAPSLNLTDAITLAAWVKADPVQGPAARIIDKSVYPTAGYNLQIQVIGVPGLELRTNSWRGLYGATSIIDNEWHHIVGTYDRVQFRLFVDGVEDVTPLADTNPIVTSNVDLQLSQYSGGGYPVKALIDEVRIYKRALTAQEILRLYNEGR